MSPWGTFCRAGWLWAALAAPVWASPSLESLWSQPARAYEVTYGQTEVRESETGEVLTDRQWQSWLVSRFFDRVGTGRKADALTGPLTAERKESLAEAWASRFEAALPELLATVPTSVAGELESLARETAAAYQSRYRKELELLFLNLTTFDTSESNPAPGPVGSLVNPLVEKALQGAQASLQALGDRNSLENPPEYGSPQGWDGPAREDNLRRILSQGLGRWDEAEVKLVRDQEAWAARAAESYRSGLEAWAGAREKLDTGRLVWETQATRVQREAEAFWADRQELWAARAAQAGSDFNRWLAEESQARETRVSSLVALDLQARTLVQGAQETGRYWYGRLTGAPLPLADYGWDDIHRWARDRIGILIRDGASGPDSPDRALKLGEIRDRLGPRPLDAGDLKILSAAEGAISRGALGEVWEQTYQEAAYWAGEASSAQDLASGIRDQLEREYQAVESGGFHDSYQVLVRDAEARLGWWDQELSTLGTIAGLVGNPGELGLDQAVDQARAALDQAQTGWNLRSGALADASREVEVRRNGLAMAQEAWSGAGTLLDKTRASWSAVQEVHRDGASPGWYDEEARRLGRTVADQSSLLPGLEVRQREALRDFEDAQTLGDLRARLGAVSGSAAETAVLVHLLTASSEQGWYQTVTGRPGSGDTGADLAADLRDAVPGTAAWDHAQVLDLVYRQAGDWSLGRRWDRERLAAEQLGILVSDQTSRDGDRGAWVDRLDAVAPGLRLDQRLAADAVVRSYREDGAGPTWDSLVGQLGAAWAEVRAPGLVSALGEWSERCKTDGLDLAALPSDPGAEERLRTVTSELTRARAELSQAQDQLDALGALAGGSQTTEVFRSWTEKLALARDGYRQASDLVRTGMEGLSAALDRSGTARRELDVAVRDLDQAREAWEAQVRIRSVVTLGREVGDASGVASRFLDEARGHRDRAQTLVRVLAEARSAGRQLPESAWEPYRQAGAAVLDQILLGETQSQRQERLRDRIDTRFDTLAGDLGRYLGGLSDSLWSADARGKWIDHIGGAGGPELLVGGDFRLGSREPGDPTGTETYGGPFRWDTPDVRTWFSDAVTWAGSLSSWAERDPEGCASALDAWGLAFGHLLTEVHRANPEAGSWPVPLGMEALWGSEEALDRFLVADRGLLGDLRGQSQSNRFGSLGGYRSWIRDEMAQAYETVIGDPAQAGLFRTAAAFQLAGVLKWDQVLTGSLVKRVSEYFRDQSRASAESHDNSGKNLAGVAAGYLASAAACVWWNPIGAGILTAMAAVPGAQSWAEFDKARSWRAASDRFDALVQGERTLLNRDFQWGVLGSFGTGKAELDRETSDYLAHTSLAGDQSARARETWTAAAGLLDQDQEGLAAGYRKNLAVFLDIQNRYLAGDPSVDPGALGAQAVRTFGAEAWSLAQASRIRFQTDLCLGSGPLTSLAKLESERSGLVAGAGREVLALGVVADQGRLLDFLNQTAQGTSVLGWQEDQWTSWWNAAVTEGQNSWDTGTRALEAGFRQWETSYQRDLGEKLRLWENRQTGLKEQRDQWISGVSRGASQALDQVWAARSAQAVGETLGSGLFELVADPSAGTPGPEAFLVPVQVQGVGAQSLEALTRDRDTLVPGIPVGDTRTLTSSLGTSAGLLEFQAQRRDAWVSHGTTAFEARNRERDLQARDRLRDRWTGAQGEFQSQMDRTFFGAGFSFRDGRYARRSLAGSTAFQTLYEDHSVEGYRSIPFPEETLAGPIPADTLFGPGGPWELHIGTLPELNNDPDWANPDLEKGYLTSFQDRGSGELGRLMGWFMYFSVRADGAWGTLGEAFYDKKLWDDRDSIFHAPTVRAAAMTGLGAVASTLTGGWAGAALTALGDGLFTAADVLGGSDGWEAWGNWGLRALAGGVARGLNLGLEGLASGTSWAAEPWAQAALTGVRGVSDRLVSSSAGAVTLGAGGLGWDRERFAQAWDPDQGSFYGELAGAMAGSAVESLVNLDGVGFLGDQLRHYRQTASLSGALVNAGVTYGLTGGVTINLGGPADTRLVEFRWDQGGPGVQLGGAGVALGPGAWVSGLGGLGVLLENQSIKAGAGRLAGLTGWDQASWEIGLRGLASRGSGPEADLYQALTSGTLEVRTDAGLGALARTDLLPGGNRSLVLGPRESGAGAFDTAVLLAHEAHRNGLPDGAGAQASETRESVLAHLAMAADLQEAHGAGLGPWTQAEAALYEAFRRGEISADDLADHIGSAYDSGADYWKLTGDGRLVRDKDGWLRDASGRVLRDSDGKKYGASGIAAGLVEILLGGKKEAGTTADRQAAALALGREADEILPGVWAPGFGDTVATPVLVQGFDRLTDRMAQGGSLAEGFGSPDIPDRARNRVVSLAAEKRRFYGTSEGLFDPEALALVRGGDRFGPDPDHTLSGGFHTGVDIQGAAPGGAQGVPVRAGYAGRVAWEKLNTSTSGYSVVLEYGFPFEKTFYTTGIQAQYMHFQEESSLSAGDLVGPGDLVGRIGSTGFSTGPHLHYQWMGNLGAQGLGPSSPEWAVLRDRRALFLRLSGGATGTFWTARSGLDNYYFDPSAYLERSSLGPRK